VDPTRLPEQLLPVPGGVQCRYCGRGWRILEGVLLSDANFGYLCDHIDDHVRALFRRPLLRWQELYRRAQASKAPCEGSPAS
jgi:hypothetical protein